MYGIVSLTTFFLQCFKDVVPLFPGLHCFRCLTVFFAFVPQYIMCVFPLAAFNIFSLSWIFSSFTVIFPGVIIFMFLLLGICWAFWNWNIAFIKVGKFSNALSSFFYFSLLLLFLNSDDRCAQPRVPNSLLLSSVFQSFFFFLCFILESVYCYSFKFTKLLNFSLLHPLICC